MRITSLDRLSCQRSIPYDPDLHPLVDTKGTLKISILEKADGRLKIRLAFEVDFQTIDGKEKHGTIEGEATTTITDSAIRKSGDLSKAPEHILALLAGAIDDDILLAVSGICRAMRLPNLLHSPIHISAKMLAEAPLARKVEDEQSATGAQPGRIKPKVVTDPV